MVIWVKITGHMGYLFQVCNLAHIIIIMFNVHSWHMNLELFVVKADHPGHVAEHIVPLPQSERVHEPFCYSVAHYAVNLQ